VGAEQPKCRSEPQHHKNGEQHPSRHGQRPAGVAACANYEDFGGKGTVERGAQNRVNKGAGIVCPETELEDAMVSDRHSEQNGHPPGPAMQQGIEAAFWRETQFSINACRRQQLTQCVLLKKR